MAFIEYFKSLLIPIVQTSAVFTAVCSAVAKEFQALWQYGIYILELCFIQSKNSTSIYAKDRSIDAIKNESEASYYMRTLGAYSFLKFSSTRNGIESILKSFTDKDFIIRELYKDSFILGKTKLGVNSFLQSSQASYYFVVRFDVPLSVDEKLYLEELIDMFKPAHVGFHIDARISDDWILGAEGEKLGINTYLGG